MVRSWSDHSQNMPDVWVDDWWCMDGWIIMYAWMSHDVWMDDYDGWMTMMDGWMNIQLLRKPRHRAFYFWLFGWFLVDFFVDFWSILDNFGTKIDQKSIKMVPGEVKIELKIRLGPKMVPSRAKMVPRRFAGPPGASQNGAKINQKSKKNQLKIRCHFLIDFWSILESKMVQNLSKNWSKLVQKSI